MSAALRTLAMTWGPNLIRFAIGNANLDGGKVSFQASGEEISPLSARFSVRLSEVVEQLAQGEFGAVLMMHASDSLPTGVETRLQRKPADGIELLDIAELQGFPMPRARNAVVVRRPRLVQAIIEVKKARWACLPTLIQDDIKSRMSERFRQARGVASMSSWIGRNVVAAFAVTTREILEQDLLAPDFTVIGFG